MGNVAIKNPTDFANQLLGALGFPDTKSNVSNIVAWEQHEGGAGPEWGGNNLASFNPLNTTQGAPGSKGDAPGDSIQAYPNWQTGLDATVQTLQENETGYSQILHDLSVSAPWTTFASDVDASAWGTKGLNPSATSAPTIGNPDSQSYGTGVTATQNDGSTANAPSTTPGGDKMQGIAGILQGLDGLYSPSGPGELDDLLTLGTASIPSIATLIFVRAMSSILFIGIMAMGIKTLSSGSSGGGGGGATNVLEFVNNAKVQNRKLNLAEGRSAASATKEEHVGIRHTERLANDEATRTSRERVASTPRVSYKRNESHIHHHSDKPHVKVKLIDKDQYITGSK